MAAKKKTRNGMFFLGWRRDGYTKMDDYDNGYATLEEADAAIRGDDVSLEDGEGVVILQVVKEYTIRATPELLEVK